MAKRKVRKPKVYQLKKFNLTRGDKIYTCCIDFNDDKWDSEGKISGYCETYSYTVKMISKRNGITKAQLIWDKYPTLECSWVQLSTIEYGYAKSLKQAISMEINRIKSKENIFCDEDDIEDFGKEYCDAHNKAMNRALGIAKGRLTKLK